MLLVLVLMLLVLMLMRKHRTSMWIEGLRCCLLLLLLLLLLVVLQPRLIMTIIFLFLFKGSLHHAMMLFHGGLQKMIVVWLALAPVLWFSFSFELLRLCSCASPPGRSDTRPVIIPLFVLQTKSAIPQRAGPTTNHQPPTLLSSWLITVCLFPNPTPLTSSSTSLSLSLSHVDHDLFLRLPSFLVVTEE